jgi:hypothetical protein
MDINIKIINYGVESKLTLYSLKRAEQGILKMVKSFAK